MSGNDLRRETADNEARVQVQEKRIAELEAERTLYFRWAYRFMTVLAIRILADANNECADGEWPDGQGWNELVSTSHSIFNRKARHEAGVSDEEFLAPIRSGAVDVEDICEEFERITREGI